MFIDDDDDDDRVSEKSRPILFKRKLWQKSFFTCVVMYNHHFISKTERRE